MTSTLTIAERNELIVDEALTVLEKPGMAMLLQDVSKHATDPKKPYISFNTGRALDPATGRVEEQYGTGPESINAQSIQRVRIQTGDGNFRYFTRVHVADYPVQITRPALANDGLLAKAVRKAEEAVRQAKDALQKPAGDVDKIAALAAAEEQLKAAKKIRIDAAVQRAKDNGFRASAWLETDKDGAVMRRGGKPVLRLAFPGLENAELLTAERILVNGELNPQVQAVPEFIAQTLQEVERKYGLKPADMTVHVASASMGTSNGMATQTALLIRGMECDTQTALEPFAMRLAHERIKEDLRENGLLAQNIRQFLGSARDNPDAALLNPRNDARHFHAYRAQKTADDGTITLSNVANLPQITIGGFGFRLPTFGKIKKADAADKSIDGAARNKTTGQEFRIEMAGYQEVTQNLLMRALDSLHMNGNIMLQLIKENEKAVALARALDKEKAQPPAAIPAALGDPLPDGRPHPGLPSKVSKPAVKATAPGSAGR